MSDLGDKNLKEWNSRYNITFNSSPEVFAQTGIFFHFKVQAIAVKIKVKNIMKKFDWFCTEKFINENSDLKLNIFTCLDMTKWETPHTSITNKILLSIYHHKLSPCYFWHFVVDLKKNYPLCFVLFYNPYMHYNFKFDTSKC